MKRLCVVCSDPLADERSPRALYCGSPCRKRAAYARRTGARCCIVCSAKIPLERKSKRTCSDRCSSDHALLHPKHAVVVGAKTRLRCRVCRKALRVPRRGPRTIYCSSKCRSRSSYACRVGVRSCIVCSRRIPIAIKSRRTCSDFCRRRHRALSTTRPGRRELQRLEALRLGRPRRSPGR